MLPILLNTSFFTLYAYPLFMGLAWGIGYYLTKYLLETRKKEENLLQLFLGIFITSWIGAKVFFVLFSSPIGVQEYLYANEFWLGGGFVFYGGLITGLLFFFIYSLILKKFPFHLTHLLIPGIIFGHAIGRIGCFLAGCCYGGQCDLPWAVHMHGQWVHPVQLYETFSLVFLGIIVLRLIQMKKSNETIIAFYLIAYSCVRYLLEFFRGDEIRGVHWNMFSSSQLISISIIVLTVISYFFLNIKKK